MQQKGVQEESLLKMQVGASERLLAKFMFSSAVGNGESYANAKAQAPAC